MKSMGLPRKRRFSWILALAALVSGCGGPAPDEAEAAPSSAARPILVVGVDGLEWSVVLPLIREGRMPHLAGLMRRGVYGELLTIKPTYSPIIWTSIATGVVGERHGIEGFARELADGSEVLYSSRDRQVKALWNILSDHGARSHIVGWWNTYPAEPILGVMVAQANTSSVEEIRTGEHTWKGALFEGVPAQVYPPERQEAFVAHAARVEDDLEARLRRIFGRAVDELDDVTNVLWQRCDWAFRADTIYFEVALDLLDEPADLTAVYFGGTDVVGHRFWRYYEPDAFDHPPSGEQVRAFRDLIPAYYAEFDRMLGELLRGRESYNVLVMSDHGMKPARRHSSFTPDLTARELRSGGHSGAPPGVLIAAGPEIDKGDGGDPAELDPGSIVPLGTIFDVTPTVLALMGIPVGRDLDGKVLEAVISAEHLARHPITWIETHTTADWQEGRDRMPEEHLLDEERLEQLRSLGYLE